MGMIADLEGAQDRAAALEREIRDLRAIGDRLQSSASRLGEYVERGDQPPYEVAMACAEIRNDVERWTDVRKASR